MKKRKSDLMEMWWGKASIREQHKIKHQRRHTSVNIGVKVWTLCDLSKFSMSIYTINKLNAQSEDIDQFE